MIVAAAILATGCMSIPKAPPRMIMDCTTESTAKKTADGGSISSRTKCPMVENPVYVKHVNENGDGRMSTGAKVGIGAGILATTAGLILAIIFSGSASSDHVSQEVCVGPRCR